MSLFGTLEGRLEHLLHLGETHDSMAKSIQADVATAKTDIQDRLEVFKEDLLKEFEARLNDFKAAILGDAPAQNTGNSGVMTTVTVPKADPATTKIYVGDPLAVVPPGTIMQPPAKPATP